MVLRQNILTLLKRADTAMFEALEGQIAATYSYWPYIEGVMEPTFSKEELDSMKGENHKFTFEGKEFDGYTSTQQMRKIEREIRKQARLKNAYQSAGLTEDAKNANIRLRQLNGKYREFSAAAGLPEQRERTRVLYVDETSRAQAAAGVAKTAKSGIINTGAISGALSPESDRARVHAERYYQSVRAMTTDVEHISANTGYPADVIQRIKNFIFMDVHDLGDGIISRFDPSFEMAQSWQRLIDGKDIQPHDITLLKHEIMEKELMDVGYTQVEAHTLTSRKFNYAKEAYKYYYG